MPDNTEDKGGQEWPEPARKKQTTAIPIDKFYVRAIQNGFIVSVPAGHPLMDDREPSDNELFCREMEDVISIVSESLRQDWEVLKRHGHSGFFEFCFSPLMLSPSDRTYFYKETN